MSEDNRHLETCTQQKRRTTDQELIDTLVVPGPFANSDGQASKEFDDISLQQYVVGRVSLRRYLEDCKVADDLAEAEQTLWSRMCVVMSRFLRLRD